MFDLTNVRFGRLLVIKRAGRYGSQATWLCKCDCGNERVVVSQTLRIGATRSCGCLRNEMRSDANRTHGKTDTPEYGVWCRMHSRCYNPKLERYPNYGGRGIKVCERWFSFENFLADMGTRPGPKFSIDRKDNDKDYTPDNCRWATNKQQARNTSRNHLLTLGEETRCLSEWAEIGGMDESALRGRLNDGWPLEMAVKTPVRTCRRATQ